MDSRPETITHINTVRRFLGNTINDLINRLAKHDASKLESPEVEIFNEFTPKLRAMTYGSEEYMDCLIAMKPALDHHYKHNDHHPEHHENGIQDMNLISLLEMLCDWKAATTRHDDGDIKKSIEFNQARFRYSDELKMILLNTVKVLES